MTTAPALPVPGPFFHAGILVADLDEAVGRYADVLGVTFADPVEFAIENFVDEAHFGDAEPHPWTCRVAWSRDGLPYYELIEARGHGVFSLDHRDEGLHHLGVLTDDCDGLSRTLARQGVRPVAAGYTDGRLRFWYSEPAGLHGVSIEYVDGTSPVIRAMLDDLAGGSGPTGRHVDRVGPQG